VISIFLILGLLFNYIICIPNSIFYSYAKEIQSSAKEEVKEKEVKEEVSKDKEVKEEVSKDKEIKEEVSKDKEVEEEVSKDKEVEEEVSKDKEVKEEVSKDKEVKEEVDGSNLQDDVEETLDKLRKYYSDESQLDYIGAMSYNHSSNNLNSDLTLISNKLRKYSSKGLYNCYKGIMSAVASGQDPRNFEYIGENLNYVEALLKLQKDTGEFYSCTSYCIMALDMASADYDEEKTINFLKSKFETDGDKAYITKYNKADIEKTAIAMIALSNHKDIDGVEDLIDKCINYIKSEQKDDGGFGYSANAKVLGEIIQALISVGEYPVSKDYTKNEKTILDAMMKYKLDNGTFKKSSWGNYTDEDSTQAAFAALSDLKKGKSMYHTLKAEVGDTPSNIILNVDKNEILEKRTLNINYKVVDNQNRIVPGQKINWTSSNETIATVKNGLVTAIKSGDVTITAELENSSINETIDIKVVKRKPTKIKLYSNNKEVKAKTSIKKDETINITAKVLDQDDEIIKDANIIWEVSEGSENISLDNNIIEGIAVGNSVVKAKCEEVQATLNIEVISMTGVIKEELDKVKTYYDDKSPYNYLEGLALNHSGVDQEIIKKKIEVKTTLLEAQDYAKNIIALISAGLDSRDYKGHDYVEELKESQDESGYFKIGRNYTGCENIILPIIALDMAGAEYNVEKAIIQLQGKAINSGGNKKYFKYSDGRGISIENTSLAIIAMCKHKDIDGVQELVNACIEAMKSEQSDNASFKFTKNYRTNESCKATGLAVQALIAAGQDPLSGDWIKNNKTVFDALKSFRKDNGFKETTSAYYLNENSTAAGFAALTDLVKNKSMYNEIKVELGTIANSIQIKSDEDFVKEGQQIKLSVKVLDKDNKVVVGQEIEWTSCDENIAVLDKNGLLTAKDVDGNKIIKVTAKIKNTDIKAIKNITVKARIPHTIEIKLPYGAKKELKEGNTLKLSKKVCEEDSEEIKEEEVVWTSSDRNVATIDENGTITAKDVSEDKTITITATSKSKTYVKKEIIIKIIAIKPSKIKIFSDNKELEKATIESDCKLKLEARAYESDDTWMKNTPIQWTSSDNNIATVDESGLIIAKEVNKATDITITSKMKDFEVSKTFNLKVIPKQTDKEKAQTVIKELKKYYEADLEYDYLEAMSLNIAGINSNIIQNKLKLPDVNFKKGYSGKDSDQYAKAIIGLIASGIDPKSYKENDYVSFLVGSQTEEGYFNTSAPYYCKQADNIAYSIIALDMAGTKYNTGNAVTALKDKFKTDGDKAYVGGYRPDLEKTTLAVTALSNHTEEDGVEEIINKAKVYIKEQHNDWDEDTNCKDISETIQAIISIGENPLSEEYAKTDISGNKITILDELLKLKEENGFKEGGWNLDKEEATAFAFAALTDIQTGKSMYKEIKLNTGKPKNVTIDAKQKQLKIGDTLSLTAKALDQEGEVVDLQEFIWSVDQPSIAKINEKTGEVIGISEGTVVITATLKNFKDVKSTINIKVISKIPNRIEVTVDKNIISIKTNKKIKINTEVFDSEEAIIQNASIKWDIQPKGYATIDENGILTALKEGTITIKGFIENGDNLIQSTTNLEITKSKTREARISEAINFAKKYLKTKDSYDFIDSMALRSTNVNVGHISSKLNIYNMANLHNDERNIINLIAACENPRNYREQNYIDKITKIQPEFYNDSNIEYVAKAIIALDMAKEKYNKANAINALVNKLKKDSNKIYATKTIDSEYKEDLEATEWVLIALANHQDINSTSNAIAGIKNYLKEKQGKNALVGDCESTSLLIQGIISLKEDPLSLEWVKYDEYGNEITLLDALLKCRGKIGFKSDYSSGLGTHNFTAYALCALADLENKKSMYSEIKYVEAGEPSRIEINNEEPINIIEGYTLQIEATIYDKNNNIVKNENIQWESSDSQKATIDDGLLRGLSEGQVKIKVSLANNPKIFDEININIKSGISDEVLKEKLKKEVEFLKEHYKAYNQYEFVASPAAMTTGIDKSNIQSRIHKSTKYIDTYQYAKLIIASLGAKLNPRDIEIEGKSKNAVDILRASQVKEGDNKGQFVINSYSDTDSIERLSYCIIALDMANADYDKEEAIKALINLLKDPKLKTKLGQDEVKIKAVALTAFAKHKDIEGVNEQIRNIINLLKEKQNKNAGFDSKMGKDNPVATARVVQALVANNINPLYSKEWMKNKKTMLDSILKRKYEHPTDIDKSGYSTFEGGSRAVSATYYVFAALTDMYQNESMFEKFKTKDKVTTDVGDVTNVSIVKPENDKMLIGKTLKLYVNAWDDKYNLVEDANIAWKVSNDKASIDKNGILTAKKEGTVTVTAYIQGKSIENTIDISIKNIGINEIRIHGINKIREKEKVELNTNIDEGYILLGAKAYDAIGNEVKGVEIVWKSSDENIVDLAMSDESTYIQGLKVGSVDLKASLKGNPNISDTLNLEVLKNTKATVKVRVEGLVNIVPETKIEVDNFDVGRYGDKSCMLKEYPTAMNVLIDALRDNGIDCDNKEKFDAGNKLEKVINIAGIEELEYGPNSGWMYFVNNKYIDKNLIDKEIKDNDSITMVYFKDYKKEKYSYFDKTKIVVKPNQSFTINYKANIKNDIGNYIESNIDNAHILVNKKSYMLDGKNVITDSNGNATLRFEKEGEYILQGESTNPESPYIGSYCKVKVTNDIEKTNFEVKVDDTKIERKKEARLNINITNSSDEKSMLICIIELEDESGKILKYSSAIEPIVGNGEKTISPQFAIPDNGKYKIKVFVADNVENIDKFNPTKIIDIN
jgi:uncharacterized protein YjdB